jgi:single-strand DNA-binding protein
MTGRTSDDDSASDVDTSAVNTVVLRGRLAAAAVSRVLPSGDTVATFRLVVDRLPHRPGARVDTLDCAAFRADVRRRLERASAGEVLELTGSLRRRFFRTPGGAASRYEVEVATLIRSATIRPRRRATMSG